LPFVNRAVDVGQSALTGKYTVGKRTAAGDKPAAGSIISVDCRLNLVDVLFTALMNTDYKKYAEIMNHTNIPTAKSCNDQKETAQ
jgi:hypothetical protein